MPVELRICNRSLVAQCSQLAGEVLLPILRCTSQAVECLPHSPNLSRFLVGRGRNDVGDVVIVQLGVQERRAH
eukprot:8925172-Heterocapsa_arctica.AAC.1